MSATAQGSATTGAVVGLHDAFEKHFGSIEAGVFRAPGRVNLIGEHTDYNDGFVMPAAIDFYAYAAVGPRPDRKLVIYSEDFEEEKQFELDTILPGVTGHWSDYVRGVAGVLQEQGHRLRGANMVLKGDVPIGAGLSSSASIEVASALALLGNSEIHCDGIEIVRACQRAEHEYAGTKCGIMDQFVSYFGRADHAIMLDCRTLEPTLVELGEEVRAVVCNTKVKHNNSAGEYNRRRADCEAGVEHLKQFLPGITALRDVTLRDLEQYGKGLSEETFRRCRHVITENVRVQAAARALAHSDLKAFGTLMFQSHASLRDDYEVSCSELNEMVELARALPGVYGARMTGGGFGGCTVNIVEVNRVEDFRNEMLKGYEEETGIIADIYICPAATGAGQVA